MARLDVLPSWQIHKLGAHRPRLDQRPDGAKLYPKAQGIWPVRDVLDEVLDMLEEERDALHPVVRRIP